MSRYLFQPGPSATRRAGRTCPGAGRGRARVYLLVLLGACALFAGRAPGSAGLSQPESAAQAQADVRQRESPIVESLPAAQAAPSVITEPEAGDSGPEMVSTWKEQVEIPFPVFICHNPEWPAGRTGVLQEGAPGVELRVWQVSRRGSKLSNKKLLRKRVLAEAREQVIMRGSHGLPSRSLPLRSRLSMVATAYDPGPRSCGRYADGYTAIGLKAGKGVVAVDPRVIPMRTRLYIPGYGVAIAGDRGSAIKGKRIDLGYPTYHEARRFGRKQVAVYFLYQLPHSATAYEEPAPAERPR
jgi:3D (Asp-Asp-Asp) domain-containing protein